MSETTLVIDGVRAEREETPGCAEELAEVMREAYGMGLSMAPVGGGTKLHLGNPPHSAAVAIRTGGLRGIVDYEPGNLTISARAGTTMRELQEILQSHNQFLPLDPPHPDLATIGGLAASNASGPIRFRYGTLRDMLIGVQIVHSDGTRTKAGGKLVKNVTGYDLCKLYIGSLGTLGIISELTFKVQPKPAEITTVPVAYSSMRTALEAAQKCLDAGIMPDAAEAWDAGAYHAITGEDCRVPWMLVFRFGETHAMVRGQAERMRDIAGGCGGILFDVLETRKSEEFWQRAVSARERPSGQTDLWLKCSTLRRHAADLGRRMRELGERLGAGTRLFCHTAPSILYGRYELPAGSAGTGGQQREIEALRCDCAARGAHLVIEKALPEVKRGLDVWGYRAAALALMQRIKAQFDPKGLLNPGRFVGGI